MTLKIFKSDLNKAQEYSYCSTQVNLDKKNSKQIIAWVKKNIPEEEWYLGENETGIELEPHCTVLYGIKNSKDETKVKKLLKQNKLNYLSSKLEHLSIFTQKDYDVLFVELNDENNDFKNANKVVKNNIDNVSTHPNYKPHMTLAYMKKGKADKYKGKQPFENMILSGNVMFCKRDGEKKVIKSL